MVSLIHGSQISIPLGIESIGHPQGSQGFLDLVYHSSTDKCGAKQCKALLYILQYSLKQENYIRPTSASTQELVNGLVLRQEPVARPVLWRRSSLRGRHPVNTFHHRIWDALCLITLSRHRAWLWKPNLNAFASILQNWKWAAFHIQRWWRYHVVPASYTRR